MTFEESKEFELTSNEERMIKKFVKEYSKGILNFGPWGMPSSFFTQDIAKTVVRELGGGLWFFGKALSEVSSMLIKRQQNQLQFEKTLSDRSVVRFGEEELEERLFDIGRYYFAKMFDHGYESLRSTSQSWVVLDDYVKERVKTIKLDKMVSKLPELEGVFD